MTVLTSFVLEVFDLSFGDKLASFFSMFAQLFYYLCSSCMMVIDAGQFMFRKLAGLETYYIDGNAATIIEGDVRSGDMFLQLIRKVFFNNEYPIIKTTFISLIILGAILLFVFTIAAMIRVEYSPNGEKEKAEKGSGNSKKGIIGNMFKAIFSFAIIPVACYFGIWFGNTVLFALDSATDPQIQLQLDNDVLAKLKKSTTIDTATTEKNTGSQSEELPKEETQQAATQQRKYNESYVNYVFFSSSPIPTNYTPLSAIATKACLYRANRIRLKENIDGVSFYEWLKIDPDDGTTRNFGIFKAKDTQNNPEEQTAQLIDTVFSMNAQLATKQNIDKASYMDLIGWDNLSRSDMAWKLESGVEYFNRFDPALVSYYYNLWHYDGIIAIAYILIVGKLILGIVLGVISRLVVSLGLIFANPIAISLMPIDGGTGLKKWLSSFLSQIVPMYFTVFAFNVFYIVYPVMNSISLFENTPGSQIVDFLFQMFFMIAGLQAIQKIDDNLADVIGLKGGLISSGADTAGKMLEQAGKVAKVGMGAARVGAIATVGAAKIGVGAAKLGIGAARAGIGATRSAVGAVAGVGSAIKDKAVRTFNKGKANRTNEDLRSMAGGKASKSNAYKNEFNKRVNQQHDEDFKKYQKSGGKLTREQWDNHAATNENSAHYATNTWNSMSEKDKAKYDNNYSKYMSDQYKRAKKAGETENYKDWLEMQKIAKDDKNANRSSGADMEGYRQKASDSLNKEIQADIASGSSKTEYGKIAVEEHKRLQKQREEANRKVADSYSHSGRLKRWAANGSKQFKSGAKQVASGAKSVGNSVVTTANGMVTPRKY